MKNKITLAINSKNPVHEWMQDIFESSKSFDERVLYIDGLTAKQSINSLSIPDDFIIVSDGKSRTIARGFNHVVAHADGEWICPFCDDDSFHVENLSALISLIKSGEYDDADVINFPVFLMGGGEWGTPENFTTEQIKEANLIPHACFIRKSAFESLGGYRIDECADWNLWIRAKIMSLRFKGFGKPVYYYRNGHERSAFSKQQADAGGFDNIREKVLANV